MVAGLPFAGAGNLDIIKILSIIISFIILYYLFKWFAKRQYKKRLK